MVIFYKKWKKYNEIQLTKNNKKQNGLKYSKTDISSTLPRPPSYQGKITALQTLDCDSFLGNFIEVNSSKLTQSNHIFKN